MKRKIRYFLKYIYIFPSVLFFLLILSHAWGNRGIIQVLRNKTAMNGYYEFTDSLEQNLRDGLQGRYEYINLNGLMARVLGINELNEVQRLTNGWLVDKTLFDCDVPGFTDEIAKLSVLLEREGIDFLCVPVPRKENFYDADYPKGYERNGHDTITEFFQCLDERGVEYINMDQWYEENGWHMEDVYFKTDHHWKPEAAFVTVKEIMGRLSGWGDVEYAPALLDETNWKTEKYENWFLGTLGKRTGTKYAGVDDLNYIYPQFDHDVCIDRMTSEGKPDTAHMESVYITDYLTAKNYYLDNAYYLYMGENYPLAYIRNKEAVNDKKVVFIGDSYRLPVECFLSTQFSEIYHIDTRYCILDGTYGTYIELIEEIEPDIVLLLFSGPFYDYCPLWGIDKWEKEFEEKQCVRNVAAMDEICLDETMSEKDCFVVCSNMEAGSYELDIDDAELTRNYEINETEPGSVIQAAIVDLKNNGIVSARYFISQYGEPQKWLFTIPENAEANYAIVIYNGMNGYTRGNSTLIKGLSIAGFE